MDGMKDHLIPVLLSQTAYEKLHAKPFRNKCRGHGGS